MPWPTPQDYNEAIQNPRLNFADPELQAGTPELTPLGLPRPITGGFASVYRLHCGQRDWAVRCFLREYADQQRRYAAISQQLAAARLPYTVGFEFLPQGIRVRGQWVPILKMEWVQGDPLNAYIESRLGDPAALEALAHRWLAMTQALQKAGIAHGDLQHGNVLVTNGSLKLIDYDGMFVPALAGQTSHEVGHRNYQHPQRSETDFGPYLDRFSAWVVYVSLVALCVEPGLWKQVGAGDEYLLFRKEDFERPDASATLARLKQHSDARLRSLATLFASLACLGVQDIPALEQAAAAASARRSAPAADWIKGFLRPATGAASSSAPPAGNPAWVTDLLAHKDSLKAFCLPLLVPRLLLALSTPAAALAALPAHHLFWLVFLRSLLFALFLNGLILLCYYLREPVSAERRALHARYREIRRAIAAIERTLRQREREQERLRAEEISRRDALTQLKCDLEARERGELSRLHATLKRTRDSIQARRKWQEREVLDALEQARQRFAPGIEALNRKLDALEQARLEEIARTLEARQNASIADFLRRQKLWSAAIPGIGQASKLRLLAGGILTAADIVEQRIESFPRLGAWKAAALLAWRRAMETEARQAMPTALDADTLDWIEARYGAKRDGLEQRRERNESQLADAEETIRARFKTQAEALDREQAEAQAKTAQAAKAVSARYVREYEAVAQALARLADETAEAYRKLEEQGAEARKALPAHHWQLTEVRRELEAYHALTFGRYLLSMFGKRA